VRLRLGCGRQARWKREVIDLVTVLVENGQLPPGELVLTILEGDQLHVLNIRVHTRPEEHFGDQQEMEGRLGFAHGNPQQRGDHGEYQNGSDVTRTRHLWQLLRRESSI
jgi:hypothetical protein